ncbi:MAG: hypothetical protein KKF16_09610 [Euryarchaeota archaeon]|nr:hypothetical protein [Euryarchaeota archaeon]MBV1730169.1 hypothetical protein [Methanobacterium sp.]MBU4547343.1 hypothetical protein [Euryarchaeota archaeon]MBU4607465.1 hypothetical protein [Euryarchaeota archaeon]MBV1754100.1 hypothetical protein [Methanobacterium sp.]
MPKLKPYMEYLENIEEIQEMDKQTIDLELDRLNQEKKDIDKKISSLIEKDDILWEQEKKNWKTDYWFWMIRFF